MKHMLGWNVILGGWLVGAPLAFGPDLFSGAHATNDTCVGLLVIGCTAMVLRDLPGRTTWTFGAVLGGLWLLIARSILEYGDGAVGNGAIIGTLIVVVSGIELWRFPGLEGTVRNPAADPRVGDDFLQ